MLPFHRRWSALLFLVPSLLVGPVSAAPLHAAPAPQATLPRVAVATAPLGEPVVCSGAFVTHELDHTTRAGETVTELYGSNGAGVAVNDLDGDGDLDIVLANLAEANTILWNEGSLTFRPARLTHGKSRAVNIVDVDGDGLLDIVFTRQFAKPTLWRNTGGAGAERFVEEELPGVNNPFYAMAWGNLDADPDLEFVAASYDTELRKHQGAIFDYQGGGVGVFVYDLGDDGYSSTRLVDQADALAVGLFDVDDDGRLDILVGNDFIRPDYIWLQSDAGWQEATPFAKTTANTMSYDFGDVDNDGRMEVFATDMKPPVMDEEATAAWGPLMEMMDHPAPDDVQIVENVLLQREDDAQYANVAVARGVDATGWSWSSKFGDLDSDGFLDIYVVNGMIADGLLDHLPGTELVEENQALRNDGTGNFALAPEWGLNAEASGRGMTMADLDGDGDLDVVVNNLNSPAQLLENQLCTGANLVVDLRDPGSPNGQAVGATVTLTTDAGTMQRDVRVASGYLSGDPASLHFGFPAGTQLAQLEIHWPDGTVDVVTEGLAENGRVTVTRIDWRLAVSATARPDLAWTP